METYTTAREEYRKAVDEFKQAVTLATAGTMRFVG